MNPDEDKLYIKIVALEAIYYFIIEEFFIWSCLLSQNIVLRFWILKFEI
jgi:hypothetical protein